MIQKNIHSILRVADSSLIYSIPLIESSVPAGFPSPAEDYYDRTLDLNELLVKHPAATFFVRVKGDSMINAGIRSQDILVVDRSLTPSHNKIVVARVQGEMTVKRLKMDATGCTLIPENDAYQSIRITPDMDFEVWGIVTAVIHQTV